MQITRLVEFVDWRVEMADDVLTQVQRSVHEEGRAFRMTPRILTSAGVLILSALPLLCQPDSKESTVPIYRVTVIERTMKAINYKYRSGPTLVDFRGTVLLPKAKGEAMVESHQ